MMGESKRWEPDRFSEADWAGKSRALIACYDSVGVLLHYEGPHIAMEIEEAMSGRFLDDLGLGDAPQGLSVWEGKYVWSGPTGPEGEGDMMPEGEFRKLTDEEWDAMKRGVSPFLPKATAMEAAEILGLGMAERHCKDHAHKFPGVEAFNKSGDIGDFFTSNCAYECGAWMGGSGSGGGAHGPCPKNPGAS